MNNTISVSVYLLAFERDNEPLNTRQVDIPAQDAALPQDTLLERVFFFGQNDFQPKPMRSVSVGDVVVLPDGSMHRVLGAGWKHLPSDTDISKLARGRGLLC